MAQIDKVVFVVFFAGERARTKIIKICEAFGANRYPFPEEPSKQRQMRSEVGRVQRKFVHPWCFCSCLYGLSLLMSCFRDVWLLLVNAEFRRNSPGGACSTDSCGTLSG